MSCDVFSCYSAVSYVSYASYIESSLYVSLLIGPAASANDSFQSTEQIVSQSQDLLLFLNFSILANWITIVQCSTGLETQKAKHVTHISNACLYVLS